MALMRVPPAALRFALPGLRRYVFNPAVPFPTQRRRLDLSLAATMLPRGTTVTAADVGGVGGVRYAARNADPTRLIVHLHGGVFCIGSPRMAAAFAAHLSRATRSPVFVPDYRLAPEHPFPEALEDVRRVWEAAAVQVPAGRIALIGDSAGCALALVTANDLRAAGLPGPGGLGFISPLLDLTADRAADEQLVAADPLLTPAWVGACVAAYAGGANLADPRLSPVHGPLPGLPPVLVVYGADDILSPDAARFCTTARAAGVDVREFRRPGLWHDFVLQPGLLRAADDAVSQFADFLGPLWSHPGDTAGS